jgi:hypothetical protein
MTKSQKPSGKERDWGVANEREEQWDDTGELREPVANPTAVQSVRFPLGDLKSIREAARRTGETTSEFIRGAAVARARGTSIIGTARVSFGSQGTSVRPLEDDTVAEPHSFNLKANVA